MKSIFKFSKIAILFIVFLTSCKTIIKNTSSTYWELEKITDKTDTIIIASDSLNYVFFPKIKGKCIGFIIKAANRYCYHDFYAQSLWMDISSKNCSQKTITGNNALFEERRPRKQASGLNCFDYLAQKKNAKIANKIIAAFENTEEVVFSLNEQENTITILSNNILFECSIKNHKHYYKKIYIYTANKIWWGYYSSPLHFY